MQLRYDADLELAWLAAEQKAEEEARKQENLVVEMDEGMGKSMKLTTGSRAYRKKLWHTVPSWKQLHHAVWLLFYCFGPPCIALYLTLCRLAVVLCG